jgi:hypothetical protein
MAAVCAEPRDQSATGCYTASANKAHGTFPSSQDSAWTLIADSNGIISDEPS